MYQWIDIWKKREKTGLVVYRCVQNILTEKYMVDRVEFFEGGDIHAELSKSRKEQIVMLIEEVPEHRVREFDRLEDAIEAHDKEFGNM